MLHNRQRGLLYHSCIIVIALFLWGCAGGGYINKNYLYEGKPQFDLAILPVAGAEFAHFSDSLHAELFRSHVRGAVIPPADLRRKIQADPELIALADELYSIEYTKDEKKAGPTLSMHLDDAEIGRLRQLVSDADVLLVPDRLGLTNLGNMAGGVAEYRLYDLNTGDLIFQKKQDLNVDVGGANGKKLLILAFIGFIAEDFDHVFVNKF